jgi:protein ImuB
MLWVALHFHVPPPGALESLAAWTCQFTPRVSLEPPQALLAEVQGSLRYHGGLEGFLARLRAGLAELGCEASAAVAATPRAALWLAKGRGETLEDLPLGVASADPLLKSLGLRTIGELLALPRDGLAKRCGQRLLDDLDRARGELPEPREFFLPPASFGATLELPGAVENAEGVLFAARRLLVQLSGLLTARQAGIRGFSLVLNQYKGSIRIEIKFASPTRDVQRFTRLLQEKLSAVSLRQPVEAIRLEAADFEPLHERSAGLFGDARADDEDWAQLLERLQARLGAGTIHGLATQPDHRPEYAWRRVEPGEWDPRGFAQPGPRPLWLLEPPRRLAPMELELLAGPERIECGWWDGDEAKRDYFIARADEGLIQGSFVWVFREDDGWFMHGIFA